MPYIWSFKMQKRYFYTGFIFTTFMLTLYIVNNGVAIAHRGHDGPKKVFMEEGEALKTMMPEGGKIIKRKEILKKWKYNETLKKWGYSPEEGVYTYFISKDKEGKLLGILFIRSIEYKHGEIELAIGYDSNGYTKDIKILSCPAKYVTDITENIITNGFLENFLHLKTDNIIAKSKEYDKEPEDSIQSLIVKEIKGSAILIKIFQGL
ncbi:MAG: hypothetical protein A3D21_08115 [Nitrospirae bacterium RIFCSPHIGHO2_02_FULL_42_12]|nr:MAG: hypothetical protein A3D21_08115 [Nitrospirae bacterium RIFCSPHIGHO2_02_FULL_42_12]